MSMPENNTPDRETIVQEQLATIRQILGQLASLCDGEAAQSVSELQTRLDLLQANLKDDRDQMRLSALYDVSSALGSSLNTEEVLNQVMDSVIQLTGAERGFLMLTDESGELELKAARNIERQTLNQAEMQVSRTVIGDVFQSGAAVVTTDAQADDRFSSQDSVVMYGLRSILCVPLRARGKIIGVVYVDNKVRSGLFTHEDREMLDAFATQAAVAIENAELYSRTDAALGERIAELETLQEIDRELNTGLDFERVLDLTLNWAVRGTQAQEGWIATLDEEVDQMIVVAGSGKGTRLNAQAQDLAPAIHAGKPVIHSGGTDPLPARLVVPARREGQTIALLGVLRTGKPFSGEAEQFLLRLAEHAALAIENTRLYRAVQDANLAKSQFVSLVSHELKNPMTTIRGYADLMSQGVVGEVNEKQLEFLGTILSNIDQMARLVSDLSDISRIEVGRMKIDPGKVQLDRYLQEITADMNPQFDAKAQTVILDLPDDLPQVLADRTRLVQILNNLLSNAQKYTPAGGEIVLTAAPEGEYVRVTVQDNGIGMNEEDLAKLFTQFFRSENSIVRDQPGWGLGLNVTQQLVHLMGGEIGAESELGDGSTFWFTLPISN
jgi:signal transduction histidine kinase